MNEQLARWLTPAPQCEAGGYVQALVEWGLSAGLLAEDEANALGGKLAALFHARGLRKLAGDSASMRVETAREVMDGVLYTLGLHLKARRDAETALRTLAGAELNELYREARQTVEGQFQTARRLWRAARNTAVVTPHIAYRETLLEGVGGFFRWYDMDFAPNQTPGDIDYPLALPVPDGGGVEFMRAWLERLLLENRFCRRFAPEAVHGVLLRGHADYRVLLVNLFEPVLLCALGAHLAGGEVAALSPRAADVQALAGPLGVAGEDTAAMLARGVQSLCAALGMDESDALAAYAARVAKQNAAACYAAAQSGHLPTFFYAAWK